MLRIGVLTFHKGTNYGGFLQCFALYRFLKNAGHDVSVIDFSITRRRSFLRQSIDRILSISSLSDVTDIFHRLIRKHSHAVLTMTSEERQQAEHLFEQARKNSLVLTGSVTENTIGPIANQFDAIVIGSDQVWADIHEKQPVFLGDRSPKFPGKLIAYAACSPLKAVQRPYIRRNTKLLSRFDGISVRDQHTAKILADAHNVQYPVVADPTLLFQNWDTVEESMDITGKYILFYIIRKEISGSLRDAAARLKKIYPDCKILAVLTTETKIDRNIEAIDDFVIPNPFQWIYLVKHAECVLTDSFHCVVFSLQFSVPFFAYYQNNDNGKYRFLELRNRFGFSENFITDSKMIQKFPGVKDVHETLADFTAFSRNFLETHIPLSL